MSNQLTNLGRKLIVSTLLGLILFAGSPASAQDADPLASWSKGPTKTAIVEFQIKDGRPVLVRQPKINFIDDKAGKPVGIYQHIGQRPILAFGNADADMQMIQYAKAGNGRSLGLFVHHTDAEREFAYDRKSHVGTLDKVLDMAKENDWSIVDMKRDWKHVFREE